MTKNIYEISDKNGKYIIIEVIGRYTDGSVDASVDVDGQCRVFEDTDDADEMLGWCLEVGCDFKPFHLARLRAIVQSVLIDGESTVEEIDEEAETWSDEKVERSCSFIDGWSDQGERFEMHELESYLGEFADDFDIDAILDDATVVNPYDGNRYWRVNIDLAEICRNHEK